MGYWQRTDEGSDPYGELIQVNVRHEQCWCVLQLDMVLAPDYAAGLTASMPVMQQGWCVSCREAEEEPDASRTTPG